MSVIGKFQTFDLHMKTVSDYYKGLFGIEIQHQHNVLTDGVHIYAKMKNSKGVTYTASVVISRIDIEDEHSDEIISNMVRRLIQDVKDSEMTVNVGSFKTVIKDALLDVSDMNKTVGISMGGGGSIPTAIGGGGALGATGHITGHQFTSAYVDDQSDLPTLDEVQKMGMSIEDLSRIAPLKNAARGAHELMFSYLPKLTFSYNRMRIEQSIVLAGGFFASEFHAENPKDIDIFILNSPVIHKAFHDAIIELHGEDDNRFKFSEGSYLTAMNNKIKHVVLDTKTTIQYIFTEYNTREELISHFDAEHACVSYHKGTLFASPLTIDCIKNKILKSHKGNTIAQWRVDKFIKKGFNLAANRV